MAGSDHLPQLPLMLAGVPRPVAELLRESGIPTAALPRVALTASGTGRFVLYDSRSVTSALRAKRAARQGLEPIDLASFATPFGNQASLWNRHEAAAYEGPTPAAHAAARSFLNQLKVELEVRGGVWLRLGDYPFPYQSAMCVAVEHVSEELPDFIDVADGFPGRLTHLLSSRLQADALSRIVSAGRQDLGWMMESEAFEFSSKKTLAQWASRLERFHAAGLAIRGLAVRDNGLAFPSRAALRELGFTYSAHPFAGAGCRTQPSIREAREACWLQFGMVPLPDLPAGGSAERGPARPPSSVKLPSVKLSSANLSPGALAAGARSTGAGGPKPGPSPDSRNWIDSAHVLGPDSSGVTASLAGRQQDWMLDWVREHYQSGSPMFLHASTARLELTRDLRSVAAEAARCSLMWQTTLGDFANWWKLRRQMELQVWRRDDAYEIHANGDFSAFPWSIEIWRGAHMATLPLKQPELNIRDDGLVFLKAQNKSPAGFTVPGEAAFERTVPRSKERLRAS